MMLEESKDTQEQVILSDILSCLENGNTLYESLSSTELFPSYFIQMVRIGEKTGKLDDVFSSLASHYQREDTIKHSIRHALTYPLLMTAMMILAVLVIFLFYFGKQIIYHLPYTKNIYEKIAACRFSSAMALALSSGLNPDLSMELVLDLNEDPYFAKKLELCKASVTERMDLSKALVSSGIFSGLYARMAFIGSKSGSLAQSMTQITESYQEEIDAKINEMLSIIEPTLVVVLSLIVGVILLSVMFPLIGIMSSL